MFLSRRLTFFFFSIITFFIPNILSLKTWHWINIFYWCFNKIQPIKWWWSKKMHSASRTLRLAVVVLNSLLTGLFPIPFTSCCLEHICLAASLRAWPQLRGRGLHGSVEAPDPFGATVHLWISVTDFCICLRMQRYVIILDSHRTANANMSHFLRFGLDVEVNLGGHLWDRLYLDPSFFSSLLRIALRKLYPPSKILYRWKNTEVFELDLSASLIPIGSQTCLLVSIF